MQGNGDHRDGKTSPCECLPPRDEIDGAFFPARIPDAMVIMKRSIADSCVVLSVHFVADDYFASTWASR